MVTGDAANPVPVVEKSVLLLPHQIVSPPAL
jgi:hypothetical protein